MDINFIQETIDSLRTLTQQNGALTRQNSQLINEVAKESTINTKAEEIKQAVENIDLSPLENKMEEGVNNLSNKIDNIKLPEIDTSAIAKQGDNPDATLTAIYKLLIGSNEPSPDIPEGVAERLALILEFFGMKPIQAYEFMTPEEVCTTLEDIMTSMDLGLTPEKAKEITNNTLTNALHIQDYEYNKWEGVYWTNNTATR